MILHATVLTMNFTNEGQGFDQLLGGKTKDINSVFPDNHMKRLYRGLLFTFDLMKDNYHVPQFGDNDSGRFFNLYTPNSDFDHSHLIALGSKIFDNGKFKKQCGVWDQEALVFLKNVS